MQSCIERYRVVEAHYHREQPSLHEDLALLDFQLRFVTLCAASLLRGADPEQVNLSRAPGFGTWIAFLRRTASLLGTEIRSGGRGKAERKIFDLVSQVLQVQQSYKDPSTAFHTLERLRNHLSHGGPVPVGIHADELLMQTQAATKSTSAAIYSFLSDAAESTQSGEHSYTELNFVWPDVKLTLWPFICVDASGNWCFYAQYTGGVPVFIRPGPHPVRLDLRDEHLILALSTSLSTVREDRTVSNFISELREDLSGFRDRDFEPHHHFDTNGSVTFIWLREVADSNEERIDSFRIEVDGQRQWRSADGTWQPYSYFLRELANWPMVARRIRQQLEEFEARLSTEEATTLGWSQEIETSIEPEIRLADLHGTQQPERLNFEQLRQRLDDGIKTVSGQTHIYFMTGEAGIGKTRTLVKAALERARQVEDDSGPIDHLPLFLYVRSTGQVLDSLQTVVQAAVAATKNLTEATVRTLSRNGLMVLLIDGFDELLGGVGYQDALGSLRWWIESLRGRGAIVVSARSSYYLNQYRSSLRQNSGISDLAVAHHVAELQRWSTGQVLDYLQSHGLSPRDLLGLGENDKKLLRLPFFARVFVEDRRISRAGALSRPLPERLLEQYLIREEAKLLGPAGARDALLSRDELRQMFENLADLMAEQHEREVTIEELRYATQIAINNDDLESRRGLTNRLSVLCGLAVSTNSDMKERRFAFQHELFYDEFLAGAILRQLTDGGVETVYQTLSKAQWRAATVASVVRTAQSEIRDLLRSAGGRSAQLSTDRVTAFRSNIGSLWAELARESGRLDNEIIEEAVFDTLDLRGVSCESTKLVRCHFGILSLPPAGPWRLAIQDTTIDTLKVQGTGEVLASLSGINPEHVSQILTAETFAEAPRDVVAALHRLGVALPVQQEEQQDSQLVEAVRFFLRKMEDRVDSIVITDATLQHNTDKERWSRIFGTGAWADFVRAMKQAEVVELESLQAGGPSKSRLRFLRPPALLLDSDNEDDRVREFWRLVRRAG
ncbi:NACHT domain-containing protein [Micromonospora humidisoli]|uniref:NACHT domain-containing protein n=1 Tax=Micromonospora humidisoli TaxID=2807622 RepID=A0ABS2J9X5_9ACTN|nr:hypothetical protein [Micromonospora humidisoli]MBM7083361.1 hypothetical protein [Micromonospora humidisoli]